MHADQRRLAQSSVLTPWAARNVIGGALWLRELAFAKLAILSRGAALIDYWPEIKRERDIPIQTLAWEVDSIQFARSGLNWGNTLYRYVMTEDQDASTRRLNGDRWIFRSIANLPGFSTVPHQEALYFYGAIGGDIPHFHHIQVTPPSRKVTMVGGGRYTVQFRSEGGEPPILWSVSGPDWMTIDGTGLVTLAPPELPAGTVGSKDVYAAVTANGQQDVEGHASLTVEVLPIRD